MDKENDIAPKGVDDGIPAVIETIGESEPIGAPPVKPPKKRKSNAIFTVLGLIVIALCVGANYLLLEISTNAKYVDAKELYAEGYYAEAQALFEELGDYKNAAEWIIITKYASGIYQYELGDYLGAMETFQSLGSYGDSVRWTIASQYQYGLTLLSEENYTQAREYLVIASEYEDTEALIQSCDYAIAIQTLEEGDYTTAITLLEELDEYEDAADYIETAKDARKYASLKEAYQDIEDSVFYDTVLATINHNYSEAWEIGTKYAEGVQTAEEACDELLYGTWYSRSGSENLVIDTSYINGREYALEYVQSGAVSASADIASMFFGYFLDNPTDKFLLFRAVDEESLWSYSEVVYNIFFFEVANGDASQSYRNVTQAKYQSLEEEYEVSLLTPKYSNNTVLEKTFELFEERAQSGFNWLETNYSSTKYSNGSVYYDATTKTYTCTMTGQFTTYAIEVRTYTYFVQAEYRDTGSSLVMTSFSMY